jgi:hypothetical protein
MSTSKPPAPTFEEFREAFLKDEMSVLIVDRLLKAFYEGFKEGYRSYQKQEAYLQAVRTTKYIGEFGYELFLSLCDAKRS